MRSTHRPSGGTRRTEHRSTAAPRPVQQAALGDARFAALLAQANTFFANAERDMVAEKAAAITEIKALMLAHGLTVDDIGD